MGQVCKSSGLLTEKTVKARIFHAIDAYFTALLFHHWKAYRAFNQAFVFN